MLLLQVIVLPSSDAGSDGVKPASDVPTKFQLNLILIHLVISFPHDVNIVFKN